MTSKYKAAFITAGVFLALFFSYFLFSNLGSATGTFENPHGSYDNSTPMCAKCHSGHGSQSLDLLRQPTQRGTCYACHDGSGSNFDIKSQFGEKVAGSVYSRHPVPSGDQLCTTCHNPHLAPGNVPGGTPRLLAVGESKVSSGNEVCGVCHGSGSVLPGGDMVAGFVYTAHDTQMNGPDSGTLIKCARCHQPHGSPYDSLLRTSIRDQSGNSHDVTGNNNTVCFGCHIGSRGDYSGRDIYSLTKHGTVTSSVYALTTWPGTTYTGSQCMNCHEPHGKTGLSLYRRAEGSELCEKCHDDPTVNQSAYNYSYRGITAYNATPHAASQNPPGTFKYNLNSSGSLAWSGGTSPLPSAPGTPADLSAVSNASVNDSTRWITDYYSTPNQDDGKYNYQVYRFNIIQGIDLIRQVNIKWLGYGEPTTGYNTDLFIWNRTGSTWESLDSKLLGNEGTLSGSVPAGFTNYIDTDGSLYLMARAKHDGTAPVVSGWGPAEYNAASPWADIAWSTDENATSHVDYGTTTAYGNSAETAGFSTSHSVRLSGLTAGQLYYYRITTRDALGNTAEKAGSLTAKCGKPRLNIINSWSDQAGAVSQTLSWNAVPDPSGNPVDYYLEYSTSPTFDPALTQNFGGWRSNVYSQQVTVNQDTTYYWRVKARDAYGSESDWSSSSFSHTYSCPILYTWDGTKFVYNTDISSGADVGLEMAPGKYKKPIPDEQNVIPGRLLAEKEGKYLIKIKNEQDEVDFIDRIILEAVDHPVGTSIALNDFTRDTQPYRIYTYSDSVRPVKKATFANNPTWNGGKPTPQTDITDLVSAIDNRHAIGALFDDNQFTLDLGDLSTARDIKLVIVGWNEFATAEERTKRVDKAGKGQMMAPRLLEVQQPDGTWKSEVVKHIPGYTKTAVLDLTGKFPKGTKKFMVRLRGMYRPHFDFIGVDTSPQAKITVTPLSLMNADLQYDRPSAYAKYPAPYFDYYTKRSYNLTVHGGKFTRYGDVLPLVGSVDDLQVIMDTGDELTLSFKALPPPAPGMTRSFVLKPWTYYKELSEARVEPIPFRGMDFAGYPRTLGPYPRKMQEYIKEWNTREHPVVNGKAVAPERENRGFWNRLAAFFRSMFAPVARWFEPSAGEQPPGRTFSPENHYSLNTNYVEVEVISSDPSVAAGDCALCHAVHGNDTGFGAPYPKQLKQGMNNLCYGGDQGCHMDPANSADSINIQAKMASVDNTAKHNLECTYCHDPHTNDRYNMYSNADARYINYDAAAPLKDYVGSDGSVYVMARAQHDGTPPVISNRAVAVSPDSATVTWATNEPADSTVEVSVYSDLAGAQPFTDAASVTSHSVAANPLSPGQYYYRIKSADAVGNQAATDIYSFLLSQPPATPALDTIPSKTLPYDVKSGTVTLSVYSGGIDPEGDPVEFAFEIRNGASDAAQLYGSGGYAATSSRDISFSVPNSGVTYTLYARSRARDSNMAYSPWGPWQPFTVDAPKSGSCPFVFTWDGKQYQYISDMSGPWINLDRPYFKNYANLLPFYLNLDPLAADSNNRYKVKIRSLANSEIDIIDRMSLMVADLPKGYEVFGNSGEQRSNERQYVPRELYTVKDPRLPARAVDKNGNDILKEVSAVDDNPAPVDLMDPAGPDEYTFDFGDFDTRYAKILIDGWTHFPNNKYYEKFKPRISPQVQVVGKDGKWKKVRDIGFISGDLKTMVIDLSGKFPSKDKRVRLYVGKPTTRVVIDRVRLDDSPPVPVQTRIVGPVAADLHYTGESNQVGDNYQHRLWASDDVKPGEPALNFYGRFTRYGSVVPLVNKTDDMFAIMQHGDELSLEYEAPPLKPGFDRKFILVADFYYKTPRSFADFGKPTVHLPVDPLPFHGMKDYPPKGKEKYPDDPAHRKYREEWNTREYVVFDGKIVLADDIGISQKVWVKVRDAFKKAGAALSGAFRGVRLWLFGPEGPPVVEDAKAAGKTKVDPQKRLHYSLNADYMALDVFSFVYGNKSYFADSPGFAAWYKGSQSSPDDPGTAADAGMISAITSLDGTYWRTNEASLEGAWNYQTYKFTVSESVYKLRRLSVRWNGYGEPTAGHNTELAFWNFRTSAWDVTQTALLGTDGLLTGLKEDATRQNCLACHDSSPPPGVSTAGLLNISSYYNSGGVWTRSGGGDPHGAKASSGWGGAMKAPYTRGFPAMPCEECHDTHGSSNAYHLRESVNGTTGITGINSSGQNAVNFCTACHASNYHQGCVSCHTGATDNLPAPATTVKCFQCHNHSGIVYGSRNWEEPTECHNCHTPYPYDGSGHGAAYNP